MPTPNTILAGVLLAVTDTSPAVAAWQDDCRALMDTTTSSLEEAAEWIYRMEGECFLALRPKPEGGYVIVAAQLGDDTGVEVDAGFDYSGAVGLHNHPLPNNRAELSLSDMASVESLGLIQMCVTSESFIRRRMKLTCMTADEAATRVKELCKSRERGGREWRQFKGSGTAVHVEACLKTDSTLDQERAQN